MPRCEPFSDCQRISILIEGEGHDKFALPEKTLNDLPLKK